MEHFGAISALAQRSVKPQFAPEAGDYKALVLVFWQGGNDGNNTIIPNHNDLSVSNYSAYSSARNIQGLAIAREPAFADQRAADRQSDLRTAPFVRACDRRVE